MACADLRVSPMAIRAGAQSWRRGAHGGELRAWSRRIHSRRIHCLRECVGFGRRGAPRCERLNRTANRCARPPRAGRSVPRHPRRAPGRAQVRRSAKLLRCRARGGQSSRGLRAGVRTGAHGRDGSAKARDQGALHCVWTRVHPARAPKATHRCTQRGAGSLRASWRPSQGSWGGEGSPATRAGPRMAAHGRGRLPSRPSLGHHRRFFRGGTRRATHRRAWTANSPFGGWRTLRSIRRGSRVRAK